MVRRYSNKLNTLFVKILLSFWVILLLTVLSAVLILRFSDNTDSILHDNAKLDLARETEHIRRFYERFPHSAGPVPPMHEHQREIGRTYIVDKNGQILNRRGMSDVNKRIRQFILDHDDPEQPRVRITPKYMFIGPSKITVSDSEVFVYLERRLEALPQKAPESSLVTLNQFRSQPKLMLVLLAIISLIASMLLAWHISKPLKQLRTAANQLAKGDLETRLPNIHRGDEVGQLASSLELMVSSLRNAINNQRRLLSDISHELRSPLTRLNMAVGLSNKRYGLTNENSRIERESERLEEMINALLGLSRMQLDENQREIVRVSHLIKELSEDCRFEAEQLSKKFSVDNQADIQLTCYPQPLLSAIENLCRNAIKYASESVLLQITTAQKQLYITVRDDGPGIDEQELEQIFRPFYRASSARDRESGGVGLGLAIADWAVRQHSGSILATNRRDRSGLEVTIHLPTAIRKS